MQAVVQYIFAGLAIGGIYALVALGFHIMWSAARAVNFAHGDTLMLGAVLAIMGLDAGLPFPVAVALSLLASCIFGVLVERFAVRPFAKTATSIGWMLTTIAVGIMLEALVTMRFGGFSRALPSPGVAHAISIFGAGVYPQELLIPAVALVLMFGFGWMQRNTLIGRAMQAVSFDRTAAGLMGINVNAISAFSFALAAALGGAAGILVAPVTQASATMGLVLGLKGFAVAIIGGITSAPGVVIAGLGFGVLEKFVEGYISTSAREIIGFSVTILVLLIFPQGPVRQARGVQGMSARATTIGFSLLALFLAVVPLTAANEYSLRLFMIFLIYAIVSVGLNVLVGLAGLVSLGQAGLFAVGSYAAAILSKRYGFDLVASGAAAILVASAFGALLAYPTVRVRGVYLAVITIAFGLIIENVAIEFPGLTGGTTGISGIPKPSAFGLPLKGMRYYWVLAVVLFVATWSSTTSSVRSTAGPCWQCRRAKQRRAALVSMQRQCRTFAFVLSAATAGLAGALYAFLNSYISPDIFTFSDSVRFLLMVIFGGAGTTTGSLLGALILTYLPEYLQQFQYWQTFAYGLLLALVMYVLPLGVFGTIVAAVRRFRPQNRSADVTGAPGVEDAVRDAKAGAARGGALAANGLTVKFDGLVALNDVTLAVRPAAIHALIGPNGAGKSTFVNTVTGFYRPNAGRFEIDGLRAQRPPALRHRPRGTRPDLSEHRAVRRPERHRKRDGRVSAPSRLQRLRCSRTHAAASVPRRSDAARPRSAFWRLSISRTMRKKKRAFCRSACSAGSKSRAPSPPRRACCFWMSRPRV